MAAYEYKVVPAPTKGQKDKGVKGAEARFARAIEVLMNDLAHEGWEYLRADTLPSVERSGLTGSSTEWRNLLVFRREVNAPVISTLRPEPQVRSEPVESAEDDGLTAPDIPAPHAPVLAATTEEVTATPSTPYTQLMTRIRATRPED